MNDAAKGKMRPIPVCKFVSPDDTETGNEILRREPATIDEWKASIQRCMELVEARMDDIERRIISGDPIKR